MNALEKLPELEEVCPSCMGRCGTYDSERDSCTDCETCHGSGFVPTETGKKILALVRHNHRVKVSAEILG
ncbi:hypothetical protein [Luteolibacter flavescens]|uniref:hypothetical protein n=1 Tax=Luteolibacter flavescens TaxID=1859460 RepID=UPI003CCD9AB9